MCAWGEDGVQIDSGAPRGLGFAFDADCHMGYFRNFHIPEAESDGLVKVMDQLGIDMIAVSHHAAISADFEYGNNEVALAIGRHPGRDWILRGQPQLLRSCG